MAKPSFLKLQVLRYLTGLNWAPGPMIPTMTENWEIPSQGLCADRSIQSAVVIAPGFRVMCKLVGLAELGSVTLVLSWSFFPFLDSASVWTDKALLYAHACSRCKPLFLACFL